MKHWPRTRTLVSLLAAAFMASLGLLMVRRKEFIALFRREPVVPSTQEPLPRTPQDLELTRHEQANELRREAYPLCGQASWTLCESKLDEAKALDRRGEQDPNVMTARREIYVARHPDAALFVPDTKRVPDAGRR